LGNLKVGDKIIVTDVLVFNDHSASQDHLKFTIQEISLIHSPEDCYPYIIETDTALHWVEGIPYSPLVMELL